VSNNFSLARMVQAPWGGCLSCGDPESRAWYREQGLANLPWSSQAQGFFAGRFEGEGSKHEFAKCWTSDDNLKRLARVRELAAKLKVDPTNVALAWVLHQDQPIFPLIGPLSPAETWSSVQALKIELSPAQLAWLNLEA